jgi:hypothetical protein
LDDAFFPDMRVTGQPVGNVPFGVANFLGQIGEIAVIVAIEIGINSAGPESLEQMGLPEVADIIVDAGSFGPGAHRPEIAEDDSEENDRPKQPYGARIAHSFHRHRALLAFTMFAAGTLEIRNRKTGIYHIDDRR